MENNMISIWANAHIDCRLICPRTGGRITKIQIHSPMAGHKMRVVLSNRYGKKALEIKRITAKIGRRTVVFHFDGRESVTIASGGEQFSDFCEIRIDPESEITVYTYYNNGEHAQSGNYVYSQEHSTRGCKDEETYKKAPYMNIIPPIYNRIVPGMMREPVTTLLSVDIAADDPNAFAIAAFGDSITLLDGWVNALREKLKEHHGGQISLLNMSITGNRLLRDTNIPLLNQFFGRSARKRIEWDLFSLSGLKYVIAALGTNDLIQPDTDIFSPPLSESVTGEEMIEGYRALIARCHEKNLKVVGCTILPFGLSRTATGETMKTRREINQWILESGEFDYTIDFASSIADPEDPETIQKSLCFSDRAHPTPAGGAAMADAVDLEMFLSEARIEG